MQAVICIVMIHGLPDYKVDDEITEDHNSYEDEEEYEQNDEYLEDSYFEMGQQSHSRSYMCDTCEREFQSHWQHQKHMSEHRTCGMDGCTFTAHEKIIAKHIRMQHSSGLYEKIRNVITPEDVSKWVEERKRKYPKKENVEMRYKQQEEMLRRGELLQKNSSRFNKNNKTRFTLNRQSSTRQRAHNKNVPTKRRLAQQQPQKLVSLIDDKSDWNGTLFPFRGTGQLYNEEPVEQLNDFDDAEWTEEVASTASEKIVLKNALGALMSAYNSGDDSEIEDLIPKNEITNKNTEKTLIVVEKLIENKISDQATNDLVKNPTINTDEAPIEQRIERLEVPSLSRSSTVSDDEAPTEQKIERVDFSPNQSDQIRPSDKRTRKRKRVHRKAQKSDNTNKQHHKSRSIYKKRRITLLERLLANEIIHERNVLLQCVRYVVTNGFFENVIGDEKDKEN